MYDLIVGNQSTSASLSVTNGAIVNSDDGLIGNQLKSNGSVTIDGTG